MASAVRTASSRRTVSSGKILIRILIGMLVVLLLSSAIAIYFKQETQMMRIRERETELQSELQEANTDLAALQELKHILGSDAYIERVARDQLGMIHPDEIIFLEE